MNSIVECIDQNGSLDEDSVAYAKPGEFVFTLEDFRAFRNKVWDSVGGWKNVSKYAVKGATFETYYVPFSYMDKNYWLRLMIGQGDAWTFFTDVEKVKEVERVANLPPLKLEDDDSISSNKKYCTYGRLKGLFGWIQGWSLLGISEQPQAAGYTRDYMQDYSHIGIKIMLVEMEPPLLSHFHFLPRKATVISSVSTKAKSYKL